MAQEETTGERPWSAAELSLISGTAELEIAVPRSDGATGRWTPIWVVVVEQDVFVRTWTRRSTGWYGGAIRRGGARIRVPGLAAAVRVDAVGAAPGVDEAYDLKYGSASMTTAEATASTLRLTPAAAPTHP